MRFAFLLIVPVFALLAGCNTGVPLPAETDPAKGREALKAALDKWSQGGTMADLKAGTPPITAFDPDWEAGHKLTKYEIAPTETRKGVDLVLTATLHLNRKDGKSQEKKVRFAVAIGSETVVLRTE